MTESTVISPGVFAITIINETYVDWQLDHVEDATDPDGVWEVTRSPPPTLSGASRSSGTLSMFESMDFGRTAQTFNYSIKDGNGITFGLQIVAPLPDGPGGSSPYGQLNIGNGWTWPGPDHTSTQDVDFGKLYHAHIEASGAATKFTIKAILSTT